MKKFIIGLATLLVLITAAPFTLHASNKSHEPIPIEDARVNAMMARLIEISMLDKNQMSRSDIKMINKEVRAIKKASRGNGAYISLGALLIIILLLIIIF